MNINKIKQKKKSLIILILIFVLLFSFVCGCQKSVKFFLSSYTETNLYGGNINSCKKEINNFLVDFEEKISVNIDTSEVCTFNVAKAYEDIQLSPHVFNLFEKALMVYKNTDHAFNPCMYDLSLLWGFSPGNENFGTIPADSDVELYKRFATPENIILNKDNQTVKKDKDGIKIDLGGIAKGYALDVCRGIAKKYNIQGGTINIAGNIYCIGDYNFKGENIEKEIGITNPRMIVDNISFFAKILLNDTSISVSGDYERFFIKDNIRYCHILDSNTGKPINNGIMSVIIIDKDAVLADAYSTAVMVSGIEKGLLFMQQNNLTGIILSEDNLTGQKYYYTNGTVNLTNINENYEYII